MTNTAYLILFDRRMTLYSKGFRFLFRLAEATLPFVAMTPFYLAMNFMGLFNDSQLRQTIIDITAATQVAVAFNLLAGILIVSNLIQFLRRSSYL